MVTVLNLQVLKGLSLWLNELRNAGVTVFGWSLANLPTQFEPAKYERMVFGLILVLMMIFRPAGHPPRAPPPSRAGGPAAPRRAVAREPSSSRPAGVTKRFGGLTALNAVDFALEEGHIASIIGPNGAGKTTFFNVFTGIYAPEEGTVPSAAAGPRAAAGPDHRARRLPHVPEHPAVRAT